MRLSLSKKEESILWKDQLKIKKKKIQLRQ